MYLLFSKTTDFGYHSKCDYVQVEINSCKEDAAVLAFSVLFLLGLSRTKPQCPHIYSQSALAVASEETLLVWASLYIPVLTLPLATRYSDINLHRLKKRTTIRYILV